MREKKIKVVWICHFSNPEVRRKLKYGFYPMDFFRKLIGKAPVRDLDYAQWNTNGVREFEKFSDIDLHIIMPMPGIKGKMQIFDQNCVHYYCYRSEDDFLVNKIFNRKGNNYSYSKNRLLILALLNEIKPDIVHLIGAENPYYSLAALDIPPTTPLLVYLQTLMSTPGFYDNYSIDLDNFHYRSNIEKEIIKRADYICTPIEDYQKTISKFIKPGCKFLNISIAVGEQLDLSEHEKQYDFVYFSSNIQKAADYALEAFGKVLKKYPYLKLNIVGGYDYLVKKQLDNIIEEYRMTGNVFFSGKLPTHEDVISQIKKSRYALLPLKVDYISSTIREAMACGLPVVTTITEGTPSLNRDRESILLSQIGDSDAMADNMIKLLASEDLVLRLRKNAAMTFQELYSNEKEMKKWRDIYNDVLSEWYNNKRSKCQD